MTKRDHDVCCVGKCGTILEDRAGKPLVKVHEIVEDHEEWDDGSLHRVFSMYCPVCVPETVSLKPQEAT